MRAPKLLVAATVLLAACAAESSPPRAERAADGAEKGYPVTIQAANGPVAVPERPQQIVSLSPTATEMLFAIGAGPQVVAVDDQSNHPPAAPRTELSGYEPNVEALAAYDPDLVVVSNDPGGLLRSLAKLDIPGLLQPAAQGLDDTYAQIEQLGAATGHVARAAEVVARTRAEIDEIVASAPTFEDPPSYYHELDQNYFTVTSDTFIGHVYGLFDLDNIADDAQGASSGYPQLSAEHIIEADPDLVFLADTKCCRVTARRVARRPGWDRIRAVREGRVYELDDDIASRWGPRLVTFARTVARAVAELERARA
jgi:iron complex transport system substrate-binding protein